MRATPECENLMKEKLTNLIRSPPPKKIIITSIEKPQIRIKGVDASFKIALTVYFP